MTSTKPFGAFNLLMYKLLILVFVGFNDDEAVTAWEACPTIVGGGFCPSGNTCCPVWDGGAMAKTTYGSDSGNEKNVDVFSKTTLTSYCIPSDQGSHNATCCTISNTGGRSMLPTGCGVGYVCSQRDPILDQNLSCTATDKAITADDLVQTLPRYQLCHVPTYHKNGNTVEPPPLWGLPIQNEDSSDSVSGAKRQAKLAYYSSHGDLLKPQTISTVDTLLVFVHGANRNADDYFCTALVAADNNSRRSSSSSSSSILVLAPLFVGLHDSLTDLANAGVPLRWSDDRNDVSGPWRFGQEAVYPFRPSSNSTITSYSSFHAFDLLLRQAIKSFPKIRKVSIVGHSSGGQFVQRWSIMTDAWPDTSVTDNDTDSWFRAVVMNPSSYAYLTPKRWYQGNFQLPPSEIRNHTCPGYNQWQWGLDMPDHNHRVGYDHSRYFVPYVIDKVNRYGTSRLIRRFAYRRDQCNVTEEEEEATTVNLSSGWCHSHGLEGTCNDLLQGTNRLERHNLYLQSLCLLQPTSFAVNTSYQWIVPGVGHDHSLMINSAKGLRAVFGKLNDKTAGGIIPCR